MKDMSLQEKKNILLAAKKGIDKHLLSRKAGKAAIDALLTVNYRDCFTLIRTRKPGTE
jgi:hypothetical protein